MEKPKNKLKGKCSQNMFLDNSYIRTFSKDCQAFL